LAAALLVRVGTSIGALPLADVVETFRPLPLQPLTGAPSYVRGVAVIRGAAVPVVDLTELLTGTPATATRFVTMRVGERRVALGVEAVVGVQAVEDDRFAALPPLLEPARERTVALGTLDGGLLMLLQAGRSLLDAAVRAADARGVS